MKSGSRRPRRRALSLLAIVGAGIAAAVAGSPALAADIQVKGSDCTPRVQLVARDAPLADVLKELAQALDFQLSYESESNPRLSISVSQPPIDLVARLASSENISITRARNPRCPQRERITKVWVLPGKQGSRTPAALASTRPPQRSEMAERARKADEDLTEILRAHGIDPEQASRELSR